MSDASTLAVIVCGGRKFDAPDFIARALDAFDARYPIGVVLQGEARGADMGAKAWATARNREVLGFRADWANNGPAAGPLRNKGMLKVLLQYPRRAVLAFPGDKGTRNMITQARAAGVTVWEMAFEWTPQGSVRCEMELELPLEAGA